MAAPTAPRKDAPASPRGKEYITLHLYQASGEFIVADRVPLDQCVGRYVQDLEEGCIEPSIRMDDGVEGHGARVWEDMMWENIEGPGYALVWKDMVLSCGRKFVDFVEDNGMTGDEPVEIMVVMPGLRRTVE